MIVNKNFVMVKTISYATYGLEHQINQLEELKKCKYNRILIPEFNYAVFENVLTIHMNYIKGHQMNEFIKEQYRNIVYDDLVCSPNSLSAKGYALENFIISKKQIYYVDLEDMGFSSVEERIVKFEKDWGKRK